MDEIAGGLWDWTTFHEGIGADVHSHYDAASATLIDPRVPPEGLGWFERHGPPRRIVLTNRHHLRHSAAFREAFDCPVLCHEAGLHAFGPGDGVQGFAFGDELAPGVRAVEVGVLTPEETALHLTAGGAGALAFADCVIRGEHGDLGFVPGELLGDDPAAVRDGLRSAFRRLARDLEFDALLLAHGAPVRMGGRSALLAFAELPTAGAPPG